MTPSKLRDSTSRVAFDCHPNPRLVRLHLLLVRFGFGSATGEVRPHRVDESSLLQTGLTGKDGLDAGCFVTVVNRLDDPLCDLCRPNSTMGKSEF